MALSELFSDSLQEESSVSEEMANHDVAFWNISLFLGEHPCDKAKHFLALSSK